MLILLRSGLSNRLRTIVGFLIAAKLTNTRVGFHWVADDACNGAWSEIFEPLACIEERPQSDDPAVYDFIGQDVVSHIISCFVPADKRPNKSALARMALEEYAGFRIRPAILARVRALLPRAAFHAMHIRRTDHVRLAKSVGQFTELEEFEKFAAKAYEQHCSLYLATDCPDVQRAFPSAFYNCKLAKPAQALRPTSLSDSLVDVLMCAHAAVFKGSRYSSFSELINTYRKLDVRSLQ